jgi:addiction module HigA family antidote
LERKGGLPPVHPGEIIKEEILPSVGLSVTAAAKALGAARPMLHDILAGRKPLSAIMCLKVARLLGGSPEVWMRLQAAYGRKKIRAKQESHGSRRADRARQARRRSSGLGPNLSETW